MLCQIAKLIPGEVAKLSDAEAPAGVPVKKDGFMARLFMPKPRDVPTSQAMISKGGREQTNA